MIFLKLERIKRGWTQDRLSLESGVSRASICRIEKYGIDTIPVSTLKKLSKALEVSVAELFFSEE